MKRFLEKAVKWLLTASGFVTSLVILLIIGFLFTEGAGLFREKVIEEGYVLAMHKDNPVKEMTAAQIKAVFDEDITDWSGLGGPEMEIITFRLEDADEYFTEEELGAQYEHAAGKIDSLIAATPGMIAFIPESMVEEGAQLNFIEDNSISPKEVFAGSEWFPTATPAPLFGMWPLLAGTLWVSFFAILFALPFGISIAVYMAEVAPERVRNVLKPVIELLNGIPSVVYGFFGLIIIVPLLQQVFGLPVGESGLAGSERTGRQHSPGHHGPADDSHCGGGRHAQLPQGSAGGFPGPGCLEMADRVQSGNTLIDVRHCLRSGARHRPGDRRDHGRAHGHGQRCRHPSFDPRAAEDHPRDHCR